MKFQFLIQAFFHFIITVHCCIKNNENEPICEIVDINALMGEDESSYNCVSQYSNTIHLRPEGQISVDCHAPYPIDLDYDSVLPANHFDLSFFKKVHIPPTATIHTKYDLKNLNTTFYVTVLLHGTHIPWSANYNFHAVNDKSKKTTVSVFIEKNFPLFLGLEKDKGENHVTAKYDEAREYFIIPCRVLNWNSTVQLFSPDFLELTDESADDPVEFDPRVGFKIKWDPDKIVTGLYRCMTQLHEGEGDELIVKVVTPQDYTEPEVKPLPSAAGTITFEKRQENHVAKCRMSRNLAANLYGLVNLRSKNPTTTRYTHGCLEPEVPCENRKTGASTDSGFWEISQLYPSGLLKCADKEILEYFIGSDDTLYRDLDEAKKAKNALVQVKPSQHYSYYLPTETYEMECKISDYNCVKPIWWSVHFTNQSEVQIFEQVEMNFNLLISNEVKGISCGASLWDSRQFFTSYMPIKVAKTSPPTIDSNATTIVFELNSLNHVVQCKAHGIPKPTLKWFKNGKEIDSSLTIQSEGDLDDLVLLFPHVTQEDDGKYTCRASNLLGQVEQNFTIQVVEVEYVYEIISPPPPLNVSYCPNTTPGINTTTTISTTKIITFFQFQPSRSDGQITITAKNNIRRGDILHLYIPDINSSPEYMWLGMNLTVKVLDLQGNEKLPRTSSSGDQYYGNLDSYEKLAMLFSIIVLCISLVLIIGCGSYYCYSTT